MRGAAGKVRKKRREVLRGEQEEGRGVRGRKKEKGIDRRGEKRQNRNINRKRGNEREITETRASNLLPGPEKERRFEEDLPRKGRKEGEGNRAGRGGIEIQI